MLIVFGGLPATGKTTIARLIGQSSHVAYIRIDAIEQALRSADVLVAGEVGPAGYSVAYALAEANLKLGQTVIADCVNPLPVTRRAWRAVAASVPSPILEIEVCAPIRLSTADVRRNGLATYPASCRRIGARFRPMTIKPGRSRAFLSIPRRRRLKTPC